MPTFPLALRSLSLAVPLLLLGVAPGLAAAPSGGLWPCIQRKVPELAAGQMWSGPPIDNLKWQDDRQVAELVPVLAAQRTPIEDATKQIDTFAATLGPDGKERLTLLFAGLFEQINARRGRIMSGIERYAQHQIALSNRIKDESLAVAKAKKAAATDDDKAKVAELEKQLLWDTRIYDARQQSMTAVCESPVLLEQRVFALARAIQEKMP
ncbi:hypothetical protein KHC23_16260 [Ancylobacter dichloromethanicus]|uniref:Uncharacterized protein n=1 Tax=Ancylobacter dichloromethanicus TaxID=518825 RepID=A0A9W6JDF5_9HYPH|nr:hypothetical protein [Ancylobacter dichloromethanicus]MBS7555198.1 hypothetical protein [Ancylobacter dichloromethanicus]GLK73699.1 hypothetical protein GCM10017643_38170 [Ancylobacter dichloromethanicus]